MCVQGTRPSISGPHYSIGKKGGRAGHQREGLRKQTVKKREGKGERRRQVGGAGWVQWEESADPQQLADSIEAD